MTKKSSEQCWEAISRVISRLVDEMGGQKPVADLLGIQQATVSDLVNIKRGVRLEVVIAIRNAVGVSLDELLELPPPTGKSANAEADRYPNRAIAVQLARAAGVPDVERVRKFDPKIDNDRPAAWWLKQIVLHAELAEDFATPPGVVVPPVEVRKGRSLRGGKRVVAKVRKELGEGKKPKTTRRPHP